MGATKGFASQKTPYRRSLQLPPEEKSWQARELSARFLAARSVAPWKRSFRAPNGAGVQRVGRAPLDLVRVVTTDAVQGAADGVRQESGEKLGLEPILQTNHVGGVPVTVTESERLLIRDRPVDLEGDPDVTYGIPVERAGEHPELL